MIDEHSFEKLLDLLGNECADDPLRFVLLSFPWGEPGTELEKYDGPDDWQREILGRIRDGLSLEEAVQVAISSGHGIGKAQSCAAEIDTPCGRRVWGTIQPGDFVFGGGGKPTRVVARRVYGDIPFYRVSFDDGSFSDVSSGHLWNVRGRQHRRTGKPGWATMETIEILERGVKRSNGTATARQWEVPVQGAAEFEEREIDLHPYFVGVWLGDGTKRKPEYTKPFPEIARKISGLGYDVMETSQEGCYRLCGISHFMDDPVFQLGSHERYIPDNYKYNTIANRMALFEGLCDSDGEVNQSGSIGFASTSRRLAEDMIWLARSLGCKAMMQPAVKDGWYPDENGERVECRDCYRVTINAPFNPFTIEHRQAAYKPSQRRYLVRWIDSIERVDDQDGMCITVENQDGLYLANDFIVTHNSAFVAWIILWSISTHQDARGVVTANTEVQLRTKTWPELAKWHRLFIASDWFTITATSLYSVDVKHEKTWRFDATTWSETRPESFQGLHNQGKRLVVIFDEASTINDIIWEAVDGGLTDTDTEILWVVCGNPTRNSGRFKECFNKNRRRWITRQVDGRTAKFSNKQRIADLLDSCDGDEDSDIFRVRVRGVFPRVSSMQFIGGDLVELAQKREDGSGFFDPRVMGVDVARYGDDQSVIYVRVGRDARSIKPIKISGMDTMSLAARVVEEAAKNKIDAIFVDGGGVGGGVVDRLKFLRQPVVEVQFGAASDRASIGGEGVVYANKRAEIWGSMKDWLKNGGCIHTGSELTSDLTGVEYGYSTREGRDAIQLESKREMKKRGLASPDEADALALTFAYPVAPSDHMQEMRGEAKHEFDYEPSAW